MRSCKSNIERKKYKVTIEWNKWEKTTASKKNTTGRNKSKSIGKGIKTQEILEEDPTINKVAAMYRIKTVAEGGPTEPFWKLLNLCLS